MTAGDEMRLEHLLASIERSGTGSICYIHPTATLGALVSVWHFARILSGVKLETGVMIGGGTEIGRGSVIGAGSRVGANCFLPSNSSVGRNVFIGPGVNCADDFFPKVAKSGDAPYDARPPFIEDDAVIGLGAVLRPGVRIGKRARVAAGALVVADVPDDCFVRSEPAREHAMPPAWHFDPSEHYTELVAPEYAERIAGGSHA